jgi:dephospho-CoA kinase
MSKIKVGITGGIGSGKSFVANLFSKKGIAIYNSDIMAKKLMTSNTLVKSKIKELIGNEAYFKNGRLNRSYIASRIFNNKMILKKLNAIVHPAVAQDYEVWHLKQKGSYTLKEAALLIESGSYKDLDFLILVTAPLELKIERVMQRDKVSKEDIIRRMKAQTTDAKKIKYADSIIINDGRPLNKIIDNLHRTFLNLSKSKA